MDKYFPKGIGLDPNSEMFKQMYQMMRKRQCDCGYDPEHKKKGSNEEKCPVTLALNNHITFPSLKMLPKDDDPKELFYNTETGTPKQHWCFLIELHESLAPRTWSGFTTFGEKVVLKFDNDNDEKPTTFSWSDLKSGHTVAILYAEKYDKIQIIESNLDSCYIFKTNFIDLFDEARHILNDADFNAKEEKSACFGCGITCENISRCANCKLAKYCSRECQSKCWKASHKKMCSQSETLLKMVSLPRLSFEHHFSFTVGQGDSIPAYVFKSEFVYKPVENGFVFTNLYQFIK